MPSDLLINAEQGVLTLTMNRPKSKNAFSPQMLTDLLDALRHGALDPDIRLVVLTGAGSAFSAGGDVKAFASDADGSKPNKRSFETRVDQLRNVMDAARLLHEMPKPTLAVIPGAAAGAGFSLALACDVRIASTDAKLTTSFSRVGLSGDFGGSYFLTHLVGAAKARELFFTAEVLNAQQALDLGLLNRLCAPEELEHEAKELSARLANAPTTALAYMKRNLNCALSSSLEEVLDLEAIHMIRTFQTDDHKSAAKAFANKQTPTFVGR